MVHRDLNTSNILFDMFGNIKICTFGSCKEGIGKDDWTHSFCGEEDYMAPEMHDRTGHG